MKWSSYCDGRFLGNGGHMGNGQGSGANSNGEHIHDNGVYISMVVAMMGANGVGVILIGKTHGGEDVRSWKNNGAHGVIVNICIFICNN